MNTQSGPLKQTAGPGPREGLGHIGITATALGWRCCATQGLNQVPVPRTEALLWMTDGADPTLAFHPPTRRECLPR